MSAKGLLLVFAETGDRLSESDFHDWYDNEHIPLRTALPGFLSATRAVQADGQKPTWAALYDLSSVGYLQTEEYANLAKMRSARETELLAKIGLLKRRIYEINEEAPKMVSSDFTGHQEGMVLVIVSMDVEPEFEDELHRWYNEEHTPLLAKVPGWLRSRRYILVESNVSGTLKEVEGYKTPAKFIAIHEYVNIGPDLLNGEEFKAAISTPWRQKVWENNKNIERRVFKVYKAF